MNSNRVVPCLACGSEETFSLRSVSSPVLPELKFTLHECRSCDTRFFDPNEHGISIHDENEKFSLSEHYLNSPFSPNPYWRNQVAIIKSMKDGAIRRVLDCGCRTGDFLMHWDKEIERTGVEIVPEVAMVARRRGLQVINQPLEQAKIAHRYDVVTCYAILEHLTRPDQVLDAMCNAVEDRGLLAIMIPSYQTLKSRLLELVGVRWHQLYPPFHLGYFSRKFLLKFMSDRRFLPVSIVYTSGGMFNPFSPVPVVGSFWAKGMNIFDRHSPTRRLPIFDHMYMYFRKIQ